MKIRIFLNSIQRERQLTKFIEEKLESSLAKHKNIVYNVEVRINDINGTRGGVDKQCRIMLFTSLSMPFIFTATHTSAGGAFRVSHKKMLRNLRQNMKRVIDYNGRDRSLAQSFKQAG